MAQSTLADYANAHATQVGLPPDSVQLALKLLWILVRKLDRDGGVTNTNYEALLLAQPQTVNPVTLVP